MICIYVVNSFLCFGVFIWFILCLSLLFHSSLSGSIRHPSSTADGIGLLDKIIMSSL